MIDIDSKFYLALSLYLLLSGTLLLWRKSPCSQYRIISIVLVSACFLWLIAYMVADYFSGQGINEAVIYHLVYGLQGAGYVEYLRVIILACSSIIVVIGVAYLGFVKYPAAQSTISTHGSFPYLLIVVSLLVNPASSDTLQMLSVAIGGAGDDVPDFDQYYQPPEIRPIQAVGKNLVFIYAEGLEHTYFNEHTFPGLIRGLKKLENSSISFSNISQLEGAGWTMAGMVASQCGIPLFTPEAGFDPGQKEFFLPSAICLGDLLHQQDYRLVYYGGAHLEFAGKGKFYRTHQFDEIYGRKKLLQQLPDPEYRTGWGLFDDSLLDIAYQDFLRLSASGDKFALFSLTLDTHHPKGHPSNSCENLVYRDGSNPILNAVSCSDHLISDYVDKIMQSPYADQTVIVIVSDHLSIRTTADDMLNQHDRKNLFMMIDPASIRSEKIDRAGSTLDIAPTLLPLMGYQAQLGLGRNLLDKQSDTDSEIQLIHRYLTSWKQAVSRFWERPILERFIKVEPAVNRLLIDDRAVALPALLRFEYADNSLKYVLDRTANTDSMMDRVRQLDEGTMFVLVERCSALKNDKYNERICLMAGRDGADSDVYELEQTTVYSANRLRQLFSLPAYFKPHRVAHAGGAFNDRVYTNSHQALDQNINRRFIYFEIDFSFTSDDELVCIHDWNDTFKSVFSVSNAFVPSLSEFTAMVEAQPEIKACTLHSLAEWMDRNPSAFIVTDVKGDNLKALEMIMRTLPEAEVRVIPQIYKPDNYSLVKEMGYEQFIWTLYRFRGGSGDVLDQLKKFEGAFAVTMPEKRASGILPGELKKLGIPAYVHTINDAVTAKKLLEQSDVTELYTDFLAPD